MPRFAVLRHDAPDGQHFDLLFEFGPALRTWALPRPPDAITPLTCDALPDHRLAYLDYEGPVSGDRGTVTSWDRGTFSVVHEDASQLVVDLFGQKLTGRATLDRLSETPDRWQFSFVANDS